MFNKVECFSKVESTSLGVLFDRRKRGFMLLYVVAKRHRMGFGVGGLTLKREKAVSQALYEITRPEPVPPFEPVLFCDDALATALAGNRRKRVAGRGCISHGVTGYLYPFLFGEGRAR